MDSLAKLQEICAKRSITYRPVPADGQWHQLDVAGKHPRNGNGRIKLFADGEGGLIQNWTVTDKPEPFFYNDGAKLSKEDIESRRIRMEAERARAEQELLTERSAAAELAERAWNLATATVDSVYFSRKQVEPTDTIREMSLDVLSELIGYRPAAKGKSFDDGMVQIIPISDGSKIVSLELISESGLKAGLRGGQKKCCFWSSRKLPKADSAGLVIGIGESVSTMLTYAMAGGSIAIAALSCGNLKAVALYFRNRYPAARIEIVSDVGNGEESALEAARAVDGHLAKPSFPPGSLGTDINDLLVESGWQAVRDCIRAAVKPDAVNKPTPCDEWPEPVFFGETETPEISADSLPEPLAGYCKAVSDSTQTPPGMAVMVGLAAVATALQKRFEVCPFSDSYAEPLNLMTVTALDPASRKSAVVKAMTEPLTLWEMQRAEQLKDQSVRVRHERDMLINSINSIKSHASKVNAGDDDRREAMIEIKRLEDMMPDEIIIPRLWIDDVTPERLQNLMADNRERISVISAEGGIFEVIAGLYSGGKSNINVILQSHAGEPVRVERQGRSVTMLKPALTFGLAVQPSIISDLASGNKARFRGNGMLARMLYCIPKSTVGTRDVTKRRPISKEISTKYHDLIYRLLAIELIVDEHGNERPRLLTLAPDALKAWLASLQYIESQQGQYGDFYSIQDWTGKLPGAALRIAGLCHVIEHGESSTVISRHIIEKALDLSEQLIVHAKSAFDLMGTDPSIPDAKYILRWIIKNGSESFRRGDLHAALHGKFQRVDRLISALRVLTERHLISEPQDRPTGRRPEIVYTVNPAILKGGN